MWALQDVTLELYYFPYTQNVELERKLTSLSRADDAPPQRDALLQQLKYELQQKDSFLTDLRDQLDDQVRQPLGGLSPLSHMWGFSVGQCRICQDSDLRSPKLPLVILCCKLADVLIAIPEMSWSVI